MSSEEDERITAIIALYRTRGSANYYGEKVSKTDHMVQTALSARRAGETDQVVLACLLHDIGHLLEEDDMGGLGVCAHGQVGAQYLRGLGMDEGVCALVANHAEAKRYLVSTQREYYNTLSAASKKTLEYQGGCMSKTERAAFERLACFAGALRVRHHDDVGKKEGVPAVGVERFSGLIRRFLAGRSGL